MSKNIMVLLLLLASFQFIVACSSDSDPVDGDTDSTESDTEDGDEDAYEMEAEEEVEGEIETDGDSETEIEAELESEPPTTQTRPTSDPVQQYVFDENNLSLKDWRVRDTSSAELGLGSSHWTVINKGLVQWATMGDTQESEPVAESSLFLSSEIRNELNPISIEAIEMDFNTGIYSGGIGFSFADGKEQVFLCLNETPCGKKFARYKSSETFFVSESTLELKPATSYTMLLTIEGDWLILSLDDAIVLTAPFKGEVSGAVGILNYLMQGITVTGLKIWGEAGSEIPAPVVDWKVIAHRGHGNSRESNALPENTIAACKQGYADGADYLEIDVLLSSDDVPVLMHDDTLDRTTSCTGAVGDKTLNELQQCQIEDDSAYAGEAIYVDTLADAFTEVSGASWFVELKSTGNATDNQTLVNSVVTLMQQNNLTDDSYVISFSLSMLQLVEQTDSDIKTAYVVSALGENHIQEALDAGVDAMDIGYLFVKEETVTKVHQAGLELYIWTADNQCEFESYLEMGVDGITTNNPDRLRATAYEK